MMHARKKSMLPKNASIPLTPSQAIETFFFPQGLLGFRHIKHMSLSFFKEFQGKPLHMLTALNQENHAWIVINHMYLDLDNSLDEDKLIFYTIKLAETSSEKTLEASLMAPIYIDKITGEGTQVILTKAMHESLSLGLLSDFS